MYFNTFYKPLYKEESLEIKVGRKKGTSYSLSLKYLNPLVGNINSSSQPSAAHDGPYPGA
jgi:hypothetical protein